MADPTDMEDNPFTHVPIEVTVTVGKARPKVKELLTLGEDAVLQLDKRIEDPVDLYVGDRLIARGELQELEGDQAGQLSVKLTEVVDLKSKPASV
jgi:flagellar motor switch protein FliN/FliY